MENLESNVIYDNQTRMDSDQLAMFNAAVVGVASYMSGNCLAHNCLNDAMLVCTWVTCVSVPHPPYQHR